MRLAEPLDALAVGVPWIGPHVPREPLNPITSAAMSLGLALRLWRDAFPVRDGGTLVLVHSLTRSFRTARRDPYRRLLDALETSEFGRLRVGARRERRTHARSPRTVPAEPATRSSPTPTGPAADPPSSRLGRVIVAGSRDAVAARALGFVPGHSVASALEMAHGVSGGRARVGVLLAPPYAPLLVGPA